MYVLVDEQKYKELRIADVEMTEWWCGWGYCSNPVELSLLL